MRYAIERGCRIRYAEPVREHHVRICLAPWEDDGQTLRRLELQVEPEATPVARFDGFGNLSHHFAVLGAHRELVLRVAAEVETRLSNPFDYHAVAPDRERAWLAESLHQAPRLWDFVLHRGPLTPSLPDEVCGRRVPDWTDGTPLIQQVRSTFEWVQAVATWDPDATGSVASLPALFEAGRGTAADLAHLSIALLRRWGVPARFVSGYLDAAYFEPDEDAAECGKARPQTLHHWAEVLIPGAGWRGFDPALSLLADATYIRVAVGRDAIDVRSLRHTSKGSGESPEIDETLNVTRLDVVRLEDGAEA